MSQLPEAQFPTEPGRSPEATDALSAPTRPLPADAPATGYAGFAADSETATSSPRWSGKRTAIVAAVAIGLCSVGAVAAAAATPNGIAAPSDGAGRFGPGGTQQGGPGANPGAPGTTGQGQQGGVRQRWQGGSDGQQGQQGLSGQQGQQGAPNGIPGQTGQVPMRAT